MSGRDQDSNLLACLGKLVGFDRAVVVQIEVLKILKKNGFFVGVARCLLSKLSLYALLETTSIKKQEGEVGFYLGPSTQARVAVEISWGLTFLSNLT